MVNKYIRHFAKVLGISLVALNSVIGSVVFYRNMNSHTLNPPPQKFPQPKCEDVTPQNLSDLVSELRRGARKDLESILIDPTRIPSEAELRRMAYEDLPYIATVSGKSKIYSPSIIVVDEFPTYLKILMGTERIRSVGGMYLFLTDSVLIKKAPLAIINHRLMHELSHSQLFNAEGIYAFFNWYTFPLNISRDSDETLTQIVAYESEARQSLNGDLIAKWTLLGNLENSFLVYNKSPLLNRYVIDQKTAHEYDIIPIQLLLDLMSCRITDYRGVKIDALANILKR